VRRNERGAAAVEFALVLPLLVLLFAGIAELGRIYYLQATLSGAAREGVRVMALQNKSALAVTAVKEAAAPLVLTDAQILVSPITGACTASSTPVTQASVTITYTAVLSTTLFLPSVTIRGKGVMQCGG
jgi:Flp pilus assembly protein TadG